MDVGIQYACFKEDFLFATRTSVLLRSRCSARLFGPFCEVLLYPEASFVWIESLVII